MRRKGAFLFSTVGSDVASQVSVIKKGDKVKPVVAAVFLVMSFVQVASADSFTFIREGREYLCQATGAIPPRDPDGNLDCVDHAYRGPFSKEEAMRMCQGSYSTAPAQCATEAYRGPFSKEEAIELCLGTHSASGPVDCATTAYRGPFSKEESVKLCYRSGTLDVAECAIRAYRGPYSKEEALRLCRQEPGVMLRTLKLMESSSDMQIKIQQFKNQVLGLLR